MKKDREGGLCSEFALAFALELVPTLLGFLKMDRQLKGQGAVVKVCQSPHEEQRTLWGAAEAVPRSNQKPCLAHPGPGPGTSSWKIFSCCAFFSCLIFSSFAFWRAFS